MEHRVSVGGGEGGQEQSLLFAVCEGYGIGASKKLVKLAQGPSLQTINKSERSTERKENTYEAQQTAGSKKCPIIDPTACLARSWIPSGGGPLDTRCLAQCQCQCQCQCQWAILIEATEYRGDKYT